MEICTNYWKLIKTGSSEDSVKYFLKHYNTIVKHMPEFIQSMDVKYYYYLVTFTLKEELHRPDLNYRSNHFDPIENYIQKQFTDRPSLGTKEAYVVREATKKGTPHWHVSVKTDRPLKKDRFHYFTQKYGQIDISKNKAQNLEDGKNYIAESDTPEELVSPKDLTQGETSKGTKQYSRAMFLDFD